MIRTGIFKYVRWAAIDAHHRAGWMVVGDLGPTHGTWSVLMWRCGCVATAALHMESRSRQENATHGNKGVENNSLVGTEQQVVT